MIAAAPAAVLRDVAVVERGATILAVADLVVPRGGHTAVLGPNGAGKTTLLRLIGGYRYPTRGEVEILGHRLGRVDVRGLRLRIGVVSDAILGLLDRGIPVRHLVAGALQGLTAPGPRQLHAASLERADVALATVGMTALADRLGASLSAGEWQRALLARALVGEPTMLLLDEPFVGLDLAQRAHLLGHLEQVLTTPGAPTTIMVTHHLEELPASIRHAVLLRAGAVVASGLVAGVLTGEAVSATYGLPVEVTRGAAGWRASARP